MCGLAGILSVAPLQDNVGQVLEHMGEAIFSRGPDSFGVWAESGSQVGLVHRRLAILDLTEAGHQPMFSSSNRFIISFNGEIYNHLDLRAELEQLSTRDWRGHSDTETLLAAIEQWGIQATLERCVGMFAIALWDSVKKTLSLARDRFGEKPLYYGFCNEGELIFGSEIKAFKAIPGFKPQIDRDALTKYLRYNYIPAPYSIYKDIYKVEPAQLITFNDKLELVSKISYWNLAEEIIKNRAKPITSSELVVSELESVLKHTIKEQMLSDVPLGAFLSGGVDSSLIVSLMQGQSDKPVKTFSIGFEEEAFNEAEFASAVAKHLGTEHHELLVTAEKALTVVDKLADIYDEPFADSSQIPTFLVAEMARQHVTVCLSGDAGDELFCGYNRYLLTARVWRTLTKFPHFFRRFLAGVLRNVSITSWNKVNKLLPNKYRMSNLGDKLHKAADVITAPDIKSLYIGLTSIWKKPEQLVIGATIDSSLDIDSVPKGLDDISWMMAIDSMSYLPGDILTKVDRAAMAVSLETRVPFLDHRVFELAWRIPQQFKLHDGKGKIPLRTILYKYVPKELIERPKTGFAIPVAEWLRGPLKPWAEQLIAVDRIKMEGFFNHDIISRMWQEHQQGSRSWHYQLWAVLMFQSWYEKNHK